MEYVTKHQMAEVDRIAPENYGLTISRMMENAAYQIADYIRRNFPEETSVAVYAGKGNNGGDALAAARRLLNWGFDIQLRLESELDGIREEERKILEKLGIEPVDKVEEADVALDGVIGYNLNGAPREPLKSMVEEINTLEALKISVDVPSGFHLNKEQFLEPSVDSDVVLSLAAPFKALKELDVEHHLIDISIPEEVYREAGVDLKPSKVFQESSRVKLI